MSTANQISIFFDGNQSTYKKCMRAEENINAAQKVAGFPAKPQRWHPQDPAKHRYTFTRNDEWLWCDPQHLEHMLAGFWFRLARTKKDEKGKQIWGFNHHFLNVLGLIFILCSVRKTPESSLFVFHDDIFWSLASQCRSNPPDIFGYFLPLLYTGQRGDHGKMWRSVRAFQPTGSSVPFPDIHVSKWYHMDSPSIQTTQGFSLTFPATVNSALSWHTHRL